MLLWPKGQYQSLLAPKISRIVKCKIDEKPDCQIDKEPTPTKRRQPTKASAAPPIVSAPVDTADAHAREDEIVGGGDRPRDVVLQVGYLEKRVGGLAAGFRPDQNVTALWSRGLELVVLDRQPGQLPFHLDQAAGVGIGRGRKGTDGAREYRFTA